MTGIISGLFVDFAVISLNIDIDGSFRNVHIDETKFKFLDKSHLNLKLESGDL